MPIVSTDRFIATIFDYLIIGGGSSGLVLASRLSEDPHITVGVIEAGEHHVGVPGIVVPGMMGQLIANPTYDWAFLTTPQAHANGRVVLQPRGKGLGGSSLINFMGLFRPSREEYDVIEGLGNPGWNWEDMLKYTKKSERTTPPQFSPQQARENAAEPDLNLHGCDGPLPKSFYLHHSPTNVPYLDTLESMGVPRNPEAGNGNNLGCHTCWTAVDPDTATRGSTASAYYEPNADKPNLLILTSSYVTKVLLEVDPSHESGIYRAFGAEFVNDGARYSIKDIKKEVIVSCGSLQTPQILELSGIGNPSILDQFGIDTKINLPSVGENLQDHIMVPTIAELKEKYETFDILRESIYAEQQQLLYKSQKGLLTSISSQTFAFLPSKTFGSEEEIAAWQREADNQIVVNAGILKDPAIKTGYETQYQLQRKWIDDEKQAQIEIIHLNFHLTVAESSPAISKRYSTIACAIMHPLSRGSVHISSSDPLAPPAINPNYFSNPVDLEIIAKGLVFTLKTYQTGPFADMVESIVWPKSSVINQALEEGDLKELKEHAKNSCVPVFHPVGTAAMLPQDKGGVVDSNLKVYGTSNLRIVDLSVIPLELSTHTFSTALAIGEKAADIIKAVYVGDSAHLPEYM